MLCIHYVARDLEITEIIFSFLGLRPLAEITSEFEVHTNQVNNLKDIQLNTEEVKKVVSQIN